MQYDDSLCLNLMTQLNLMKGKVTKELEQLKSLSLKIQEVTSKNVAVTDKNEDNMLDIPTRGIYLQKLLLLLTWQMNQSFSVMFQL